MVVQGSKRDKPSTGSYYSDRDMVLSSTTGMTETSFIGVSEAYLRCYGYL